MEGSSPLTRGKRVTATQSLGNGGLIPAHAGKTGGACAASTTAWAHPRSRGENMKKADAEALKQGSSPLTRGKPPPRCPGGPRTRAHPRSRGENAVVSLEYLAPAGSSPLTRGKHQAGSTRRRKDGLIPAHAGKTALVGARCAAGRAHPRSRGENVITRRPLPATTGSSPLTRGKHLVELKRPGGRGLIPAHAGKTHPHE